jgi:hypothetical protein
MSGTEQLNSPVAEPHADLFLEYRIPDRQNFIEDDDFRVKWAATEKASRTYMPLE